MRFGPEALVWAQGPFDDLIERLVVESVRDQLVVGLVRCAFVDARQPAGHVEQLAYGDWPISVREQAGEIALDGAVEVDPVLSGQLQGQCGLEGLGDAADAEFRVRWDRPAGGAVCGLPVPSLVAFSHPRDNSGHLVAGLNVNRLL